MNNIVINEKSEFEYDKVLDFYYCDNDIWKCKDKIGFIRYVLDGNNMELRQIFIDERYRHKKYGTMLLDKLIEITKNNKISKIWLLSSTSNTEVFFKFLVNKGFVKENDNKWVKQI